MELQFPVLGLRYMNPNFTNDSGMMGLGLPQASPRSPLGILRVEVDLGLVEHRSISVFSWPWGPLKAPLLLLQPVYWGGPPCLQGCEGWEGAGPVGGKVWSAILRLPCLVLGPWGSLSASPCLGFAVAMPPVSLGTAGRRTKRVPRPKGLDVSGLSTRGIQRTYSVVTNNHFTVLFLK